VQLLKRYLVAGMLIAGGVAGCGDDAQKQGDYTVQIQTFRFFQDPIYIPVGSTVRWVNVNPRDSLRTVTSGTGSQDSTAGALFDEVLHGYSSGQAEGESFIYKFEDRGSFPYFSRLPEGHEFHGLVEVQ
jgi:plastocyanin